MRAWLVIALCGCGRFGFDALATAGDGAGPDAPDVGYFVSPTGSNANPGTRAQPWGTLAFATAQLKAGDTLTLVDGDYDGSTAIGILELDCGAGIASGTSAAPIVIRADHQRRAHLFGQARELDIRQCAYWQIRDLWLDGKDDTTNTAGSVAQIQNSDHVSLTGLIARTPNRYGNNNVVEIDNSTNILVEDLEAYDYARGAVVHYQSDGVVVRRLYANGRGYPDVGGGYVSACPGGDYGVLGYYTRTAIVEDSIAENICYAGFSLSAGSAANGSTGLGDGELFVDDIVLGPGMYGYEIVSDCNASAPCATPDEIAENNTIRNSVALFFTTGYLMQGIGNTLDHVTAFGAAGASLVVFAVTAPPDPGLAATAFGREILGVNGSSGITVTNQSNWAVDGSNVFDAAPYNPADSHVTASSSADPVLGTCEVYLPPGSTVLGTGPGGTNIGADIRMQTLGGTPTTTPMWGPTGTFAGCGPIVPGVNDDPATSCSGVAARVNIGANGCAVP